MPYDDPTHRGFFPVYRKIDQWPLYYNKVCRDVFLYFLFNAAHEKKRVMYKRKVIHLERGQLAITIADLAKKLQWTPQNLKTSLKLMIKEGSISTNSLTNCCTVVTICNYNTYNPPINGHQPTNQPTANQLPTNCQPTEQEVKKVKKKRRKKEYPPEFEKFWNAYPRRIEKAAAFRSYKKALRNGGHANAIVEGARRYAEYCSKVCSEQTYIKYPATWLNQECWNDEYEVKPKQNTRPLTTEEKLEKYRREKGARPF